MKTNFEKAVNNTQKVKKAKTLSTKLIAKEYNEHLKLLFKSVNMGYLTNDQKLEIITQWLPWANYVQCDFKNQVLTITNLITYTKFKSAVDFSQGIFNYLPNGNENKSAGNALKAEYDGYDASQEDYDAVAGEDIF